MANVRTRSSFALVELCARFFAKKKTKRETLTRARHFLIIGALALMLILFYWVFVLQFTKLLNGIFWFCDKQSVFDKLPGIIKIPPYLAFLKPPVNSDDGKITEKKFNTDLSTRFGGKIAIHSPETKKKITTNDHLKLERGGGGGATFKFIARA